MAGDYSLDDAAAAALWALRNAPYEHIGLLYEQGDAINATPTVTQGNAGRTKGAFSIPSGSLRGLFHNHPTKGLRRERLSEHDSKRAQFSPDDIAQAKRLGVPSYIAAGHELRRYVPGSGNVTGEPVLAEIPIDTIRRDMMVRILKRDPNDPRGLYR